MRRRTIIISAVLAAMTLIASVPALAQETEPAVERTRRVRDWPPAWIDKPLEELKTDVEERAADRAERIEQSDRLDDDQKAELLAAIDELLAAVANADANAEVVGLVISRTQLQRQEFRADRRGEAVDVERHIGADLDRATERLERLTKVTGWAEAAGENVEAINGYLDEAVLQVDVASGDGSEIERHDAVHIALAWMTEAVAALDDL
jgi:DNA repair exonuclease SbcCD ATPase subunit